MSCVSVDADRPVEVESVVSRRNVSGKVELLRGVSRETVVYLDARGRKLDRNAHLHTRNNEIVAVLRSRTIRRETPSNIVDFY